MAKVVISNSLSIHPRNWVDVPGFGRGTENRKRDTAKPKRGRARTYDRKAARLNARRNDHSVTIKSVKNATAYKTPGSMNDGK